MSRGPRDWNRDPLPESDKQYRLCQLTQLSTPQILGIFADTSGDTLSSIRELRIRKQNLYVDGGRWNMFRAWIKMYVPQWERAFMTVTDEARALILADPDQFKAMIASAAKALNISEDLLTHYAVHQKEIEAFLELQRHTLGTMAEAKLWELVASGDAATIRWVLPRIKSDIFGERPETPKESTRNIRIIEMGD